ncbi:other/Bud32 protein kinase [Coprinopsis cinerea AmutBmut pab1-1]|nr:other/Bud32 protein kinase [Coprinopsis cinerea AmutBmut pab1-1]
MLSSHSQRPLPASQQLIANAQAISQGAEARIYKTSLTSSNAFSPSTPSAPTTTTAATTTTTTESSQPPAPQSPPILLKHRFKKKYRHDVLDVSLTKQRVAGEARALLKCLRSGVNVPQILMVDAAEGILGIEWIDGHSVRQLLPGGEEEEEEGEEQREEGQQDAPDSIDEAEERLKKEYGVDIDTLLTLIGTELSKLHKADIIHGDLTTSNMMVRRKAGGGGGGGGGGGAEVLLIDFGLSYTSTLTEDKAVDLYVLERAFASTHPDSERLFGAVLGAYERGLGPKEWHTVKKRLDEVRLRGRKRSMVG